MNKVRGNRQLELYLTLYKEALLEQRQDFAYFRLWNLLEIIARNAHVKGQPMMDWQGNILYQNGKVRKIETAEPMVYELLRRIFAPRQLDAHFLIKDVQQGSMQELIAIWYRRRNCVVHGGECWCFPNPPLGKPSAGTGTPTEAKFAKCEAARNEVRITAEGSEAVDWWYFHALREAVEHVLHAQFL